MDRCWMIAFMMLVLCVQENIACSKDEFRCSDGDCVSKWKRCNGVPHCNDASDEIGCEKNICGDDWFTCSYGQCIKMTFRCDGDRLCHDGSDESGCDCGPLQNPDNGEVSHNPDTKSGATATYTCISGYVITKTNNSTGKRKCQNTGNWSGTDLTCSKRDCGPLPNPDDGFVSYNKDTLFGAIATYTCINGYIITKTNNATGTRTCSKTGNWTGTHLACSKIDCGHIQYPKDGVVIYNPDTLFEATATYACIFGYVITNTSHSTGTRKCQNNGTWTGTHLTCSKRDCGSLQNPDDGVVSYNPDTQYGATATYTCISGYVITNTNNSSRTRTCDNNGTWTGPHLNCSKRDCGLLQKQNNSVLSYNPDTLFEATATYTCLNGYVITNSSNSTGTRTCQNTGTWTGTKLTCLKKDCGHIQYPKDGVINYSPDTLFEATATYTCFFGYVITNTNHSTGIRTCQNNGTWTGTHLTCSKRDCGHLQNPDDGVVSYNPDTLFGATATHTCINGYIITNTSNSTGTRTCQNKGTWTGTHLKCSKRDCGNLTNPDNGYISYTETTYEAQAIYTCDPGYIVSWTLSNTRTITCTAVGTWSITDTTCTSIGLVIGLTATVCIIVAVIVVIPVVVCCIRKNKQRSQRVPEEALPQVIAMMKREENIYEEIRELPDNDVNIDPNQDQTPGNNPEFVDYDDATLPAHLSTNEDKSSYTDLGSPKTADSYNYTDLTTQRNPFYRNVDNVDVSRRDDIGTHVTRGTTTGPEESSYTNSASPTTAESHNYLNQATKRK